MRLIQGVCVCVSGEVERLREVHEDLTVDRHPDPLGVAQGLSRRLGIEGGDYRRLSKGAF